MNLFGIGKKCKEQGMTLTANKNFRIEEWADVMGQTAMYMEVEIGDTIEIMKFNKEKDNVIKLRVNGITVGKYKIETRLSEIINSCVSDNVSVETVNVVEQSRESESATPMNETSDNKNIGDGSELDEIASKYI